MVSALTRWLWKGSFEVEAAPLSVWEGVSAESARKDLVERTTEYLGELGRLVDFAREIEEQRTQGSEEELRGVARQMLPALDALDRVLEYSRQVKEPNEEFENWIRAVEGVSQRVYRTMEKMGLVPISTVGNEVDFSLHDVVETRVSRDFPENTVIEERLKGYYFRGRLLRDAKVVVALST